MKSILIDWKRNAQKAGFMALSMVLLSFITWGGDPPLVLANGAVTFVIAFVSNSAIDLLHYYKEKKKELELIKEEQHAKT